MSAPKKFRGYDFTVEDWLAICEMHNHRCASCGEEKPLTVDHIKPRAAGGTDALDNIQPLCKSCNCSKRSLFDGVIYDINTGKERPPKTPEVSVSVNLPADLRDALKELAKRESRSMNAQVVYLLRQAVRDQGAEVSDTPVANVPGRGRKPKPAED